MLLANKSSRIPRTYRLWAIALVTTLVTMPPVAFSLPVKTTSEAFLDRVFKSDEPVPGSTAENHQNWLKIKAGVLKWLGGYRGSRPEKDGSIVMFERGSIPVKVRFKENGEPEGIAASECPTTSVPISQAPREYQAALFAGCPHLKR